MEVLNPADQTAEVKTTESVINEKHREARLQRERIWSFESSATSIRLLQGGELSAIKKDFEAIQNTPEWLESVYGFTSFNEYTEAPRDQHGLALEYGTAGKRIKVYDKFVRDLSLDLDDERFKRVSWSALDIICSVVTSENVDDWLNYAEHMKRDDLKSEIAKYERMGKPGADGEDKDPPEEMELVDKIRGLPAKNAKNVLVALAVNIKDRLPNLNESDKPVYEAILKMVEDYIDLD